MEAAQPPAPSRRTLLTGALSALTTAGLLAAAPPQPAAAAVPEHPEAAGPQARRHPSYTAIVGLL
ncbi:hypothetical protein [Streptomyces caniscabiei]|uniref:hypothetical protein n=1 Tax=Streptomyces caniscabiei TaxID=2746961 RepID=UPI000A39CBC4|nr:hypothetical protein [Streptomyces caniscabiei]